MQSYPAVAQAAGIQRPPVPGSVRYAARVMYAGAVVTVIHAVIFLATASGALGPATWIARPRTATTLRAE